MKVRYIVIEHGPNGDSEILVKSEGDAREFVRIRKEYWKDFVEINKVPERTYTIEKFVYRYTLDG